MIWALLLTFSGHSTAFAQEKNQARPLFENQELLRLRIEAPFTTIMANRGSDEYQDGLLHLPGPSGTEQTFDLKIRTRGNYRGKVEHCRFAPLRINFRKKQVRGSEFHGQDKLKLVTHCENIGGDYEQSLLLEYLAYRILNQLTDLSFRVRLLHVDYVDTDNNKTRSKYAFLIEDDKELARRIGMEIATVRSITAELLDQRQTALFSVFQYLIGNTDFSAMRGAADSTCCHNAVLFHGPDSRFIPIAYDFDLSGIVDAPYATPNPKFPIKDVKERLYRGFCSYNDLLEDTVKLVTTNRESIERLIEEQEGLKKSSKRTALRYIDKFFDRVSDSSKIERYLIRECALEVEPQAGEQSSPRPAVPFADA